MFPTGTIPLQAALACWGRYYWLLHFALLGSDAKLCLSLPIPAVQQYAFQWAPQIFQDIDEILWHKSAYLLSTQETTLHHHLCSTWLCHTDCVEEKYYPLQYNGIDCLRSTIHDKSGRKFTYFFYITLLCECLAISTQELIPEENNAGDAFRTLSIQVIYERRTNLIL